MEERNEGERKETRRLEEWKREAALVGCIGESKVG